MTEDELFQLWNRMRKQRVDEGLSPPFEPSPMEFGARVAKLAYEKGWNDGYDGCFQATNSTGLEGDAQ